MQEKVVKAPLHLFKEFIDFLLKQNIISLAIGFIIGGACSAFVNSVVKNIFNPIIGLISVSNLDNLFIKIKGDAECETPEECARRRVVTLNYGAVLSSLISFIIISCICFIVIKVLIEVVLRDKKKETKKEECAYCSEEIKITAIVCPYCQTQDPFKHKINVQGYHPVQVNQ